MMAVVSREVLEHLLENYGCFEGDPFTDFRRPHLNGDLGKLVKINFLDVPCKTKKRFTSGPWFFYLPLDATVLEFEQKAV